VERVTLELAYWIALGVGVGFLLLSLLLGDAFDFLDFIDLDIGDGFAATPVLFTAIAGFGGGGLLALEAFGASPGVSVVAGLASSIVLGGLAAGLFIALAKQEAKETYSTAQLVGARGTCTLPIVPGKIGRVSVHHSGMTRSYGARSSDNIAVGEDVVVLEVSGDSLKVGTVATAAPDPST
jgi:membrane protein implicated in regulation of membrane protease activity